MFHPGAECDPATLIQPSRLSAVDLIPGGPALAPLDLASQRQWELAASVGKSPGEVSKLLSLLDLDPDVQQLAREDRSGTLSKRDLYALSRLDVESQRRTARRIQENRLSAEELEKYVARKLKPTDDHRGPQYQRRKFQTSRAAVLFTFRGGSVGDQDVLDALAEIRRQIQQEQE